MSHWGHNLLVIGNDWEAFGRAPLTSNGQQGHHLRLVPSKAARLRRLQLPIAPTPILSPSVHRLSHRPRPMSRLHQCPCGLRRGMMTTTLVPPHFRLHQSRYHFSIRCDNIYHLNQRLHRLFLFPRDNICHLNQRLRSQSLLPRVA